MSEAKPATLRAVDVEPRTTTIYPAPFAAELKGREKRARRRVHLRPRYTQSNGNLYGKFRESLTFLPCSNFIATKQNLFVAKY